MGVPSAANPIDGVRVLIVSKDDETIDGTQAYLSRVGVSTYSITDLAEVVHSGTDAQAILLFADDYTKENAVEAVTELRKRLAEKIVVVVSAQVECFVSIGAEESSGGVTVLRRPTWGWMLLDAIRSRLGSRQDYDV